MNIILLISFLVIGVGIGLIISSYFKPKGKRYPIAYHTVDIAIVKRDEDRNITEVLLIQKPHEIKDGHWRFPGGFIDPTDLSAEMAAMRETDEETKMKIDTSLRYIGSTRVDDPRYRNTPDKIITSFYLADYISGTAGKGFDDVAVTQWFPIDKLPKQNPIHNPLFKMLVEYAHELKGAREALLQLEIQLMKNKLNK